MAIISYAFRTIESVRGVEKASRFSSQMFVIDFGVFHT